MRAHACYYWLNNFTVAAIAAVAAAMESAAGSAGEALPQGPVPH